MTFWDWLNAHKTKITGMILVVASMLQQSPQLEQLLDPQSFAWITLILGVVITAIGFFNTQANSQ